MSEKVEELILEQLFKLSNKVDKMQEEMVTKKDLEGFATKEDLKNFATKEDLKNFATKEDLKNFATKDDLLNLEERMNEKFATKEDLIALEERLDEKFDKKMDQKLKKQTEEIAEVFHDTFHMIEDSENRAKKYTDTKIQELRNEFIIQYIKK